jgi:hypothetical protein
MEINSPGDHRHEDRLIGGVEIEVEVQWDEDLDSTGSLYQLLPDVKT